MRPECQKPLPSGRSAVNWLTCAPRKDRVSSPVDTIRTPFPRCGSRAGSRRSPASPLMVQRYSFMAAGRRPTSDFLLSGPFTLSASGKHRLPPPACTPSPRLRGLPVRSVHGKRTAPALPCGRHPEASSLPLTDQNTSMPAIAGLFSPFCLFCLALRVRQPSKNRQSAGQRSGTGLQKTCLLRG